jgi:hypothetical protein
MGEGQNPAGGSDQQTLHPVQRRGLRQSLESQDRTSSEMNRIYGNETATMNLSKQTLPIRNERVNGSNPLSGSPLSEGSYLLKLTPLGILADVTEGNVWTLKVALRRPKNGYRSRCGFSLAGESHGKIQCIRPAL